MKIGLDSAQPPSAAAVAQAKASGIALWSGYLASWRDPNSLSGFGLYRVWTQAEFGVCKALPGMPIAFCSGYDSPALCRELADAWGVRLCLDVEGGGLRDDGSWVQQWLDTSQAGLYGVSGVHAGRRAAFHIGAYYPSTATDPGATWPPWWTRPAAPLGWQWHNTHTEFGVGVDRSNLDDWFAATTGGLEMMTDSERRAWAFDGFVELFGRNPNSEQELQDIVNVVKQDRSNLYDVRVSMWNDPRAVAHRAAQAGSGKPAPFDATITPK